MPNHPAHKSTIVIRTAASPVAVRCDKCHRPLVTRQGQRLRYALRSLSEMTCGTGEDGKTAMLFLRCAHCQAQSVTPALHLHTPPATSP